MENIAYGEHIKALSKISKAIASDLYLEDILRLDLCPQVLAEPPADVLLEGLPERSQEGLEGLGVALLGLFDE